jgi:type IV pilus assembly protein PilM
MDGSRSQQWWLNLAEKRIRGPKAFQRFGSAARNYLASSWPDLVGVDASESSVKIVHVVRRGGSITRVDAAERALGLSPDAKPPERRAAAQSVLRDLVASRGLRGRMAVAAVSGPDVVVRRLALPDMKRSDILPALMLECRKHANFPIEDAEIRYEILDRREEAGVPTLDLLVTIAQRRRVEEARDAMVEAGLKPVCVTLRPVGLYALLHAAREVRPDRVVAYLDVGAADSHIMVFKGREIRFSREFGIGGATLTEALRSIVVPGQGLVELSPEEAETLKRAHGIPYGAEETGAWGRIPLSAVSVMLRPILERLVRELWNSFDYLNEQFLGESVSQVVLLGDGARVRNLPEYLAGVLKIPVVRADLSGQIVPRSAGKSPEGPASVSDLGLGLALVGRDVLNFLTPADAGTGYRLAQAVPQKIAAAAAAVLLLSVSLPAEVSVLRERQRVGQLKSSLEELAPRADALRRFRAAREEETRLQDLLARLSGGQVLWSYVLRDLSHRVGERVRLTEFEVLEPKPAAGSTPGTEVSAREVRLSGLLDTGRNRPEEVLGTLMQSLAQSPVLDQVRLEGCQTVTPSMSSFTLTARIAE